MNEFKGTKGKWEVGDYGVVFSREGSAIKDCDLYDHQYADPSEVEANAKLIAAAPELLSTLARICKDAEIMSLGESGDFVNVNIDSINAGTRAINKAIK